MSDAVSEIVKQAKVIIGERTPSSRASRQALNLIAKSPRLDKNAAGYARFTAAMSLRGHCLLYRAAPHTAHAIILTLIEQGVALLETLEGTPPDTAYQRWLLE